MKIEDCKTVNEFFGVEKGGSILIEGTKFEVWHTYISGGETTVEQDGRALVGCLTGQLEWSKTEPSDDEEFGNCAGCGYKFNSELISEYEIKYCPKCGQKIEEAMTDDEEKLLREIAAWFPDWYLLNMIGEGDIFTKVSPDSVWFYSFMRRESNSKAYEVLAPILEKYGEINLDDYREGKHERD